MVKELSNQQETDEKHTNGQAVDIDAGGRPPIVELNPPSFTDPLEEDDDSTKLESILPPITPEILEEYRKEVALREAAKENGWRNGEWKENEWRMDGEWMGNGWRMDEEWIENE
jgi:hypothetical protein